MTPVQLAGIRATHVPVLEQQHPMLPGPRTRTACAYCEVEWPCDARKLLDYIDEQLEAR